MTFRNLTGRFAFQRPPLAEDPGGGAGSNRERQSDDDRARPRSRGATAPELVEVMKRHRNVVVALFGSLEGSTDLPGADFLTHAAAYGYDELTREEGGLICRLPISSKAADTSQLPDIDQFGYGLCALFN